MSNMEKEEMNVSMAAAGDEAQRSEDNVRIDEGFWRHKSALLWCTIACIGGFQLGKLRSIPLPRPDDESTSD